MKYEFLLEEAASDNIYIIENTNFKSDADALINGDVIGINKNVNSFTQRACILAEELGHYYTTAGNILDQTNTSNRKQELRARLWAYDKLVGLSGIVEAYKHGCKSLKEAADFLDVTESFLSDALNKYTSKYGTHMEYKEYVITFIPTLDVKLKFNN